MQEVSDTKGFLDLEKLVADRQYRGKYRGKEWNKTEGK